MINDIHPSHSLSTTSDSGDVPVRLDPPIVREKILHALKTDNWDTFLALIVQDDTGFNIATERYQHGQNCFHVAIQSGSREIVMNLAKIDNQDVRNLLDEPDDLRNAPLVYAVQGQTDDPELIDALIHAGASEQAEDALELAAKNNHMKAAEQLINAAEELDLSPAHVLCHLSRQGFDRQAIDGAKRLIALDVSSTEALPDSIDHSFEKRPAKNLLVLGGQGSQKLVEFARAGYIDDARRYTNIGADALKALRILATSPEGSADIEAIEQLAEALHHISGISTYEIYRSALRSFIRDSDIKGIQAFVSTLNAINPHVLTQIRNDLVVTGDSDAITTLIAADAADAAEMLKNLALQGHIAAAKAILATGLDTSLLLKTLLDEAIADEHKSLYALHVLMLAGADASALPDDAPQWSRLDERKQQIAALSTDEKNASLIKAAANNDVVDVTLLINGGADKLSALDKLSEINNKATTNNDAGGLILLIPNEAGKMSPMDESGETETSGIGTLQKADLQAFHTLTECLQSGNIALARTLLKSNGNADTTALHHLIKHGQLTLARAIVPAVTDGQALLLQAVQDENETLGRTLMDIGVDGSRLLASLLGTHQRELAARLGTWGADPHMAYVPFAVTQTRNSYLPHEELTIMGGDPVVALLRSIENKDAAASRALATRGAGYRAMQRVAEDPALSDDAKQAKLTTLKQLGANAESALDSLAKAGKTDMVRHLVRLGTPAKNLVMDLAKSGDTRMISALIIAGADFGGAMETLQANGEQKALRILTVALAMAQSNSTLASARAEGLPYRINPTGGVDLI